MSGLMSCLHNPGMSDVPEPPTWSFSEAWLLTAVGQFGGRGCSLSEMIGAADALNHDIPTEEQAAASLGRLAASGLIETHHAHYRVTKAGRLVYKQRRGGMFELSGSVLNALRPVPCVEGEVDFTPGQFQAAYDEYARR
jgi:hypothetical protein